MSEAKRHEIDYDYGEQQPPVAKEPVITLEEFRAMVDVRAKALELALQMPNSRLLSTIYKKAEQIEKWLTRK